MKKKQKIIVHTVLSASVASSLLISNPLPASAVGGHIGHGEHGIARPKEDKERDRERDREQDRERDKEQDRERDKEQGKEREKEQGKEREKEKKKLIEKLVKTNLNEGTSSHTDFFQKILMKKVPHEVLEKLAEKEIYFEIGNDLLQGSQGISGSLIAWGKDKGKNIRIKHQNTYNKFEMEDILTEVGYSLAENVVGIESAFLGALEKNKENINQHLLKEKIKNSSVKYASEHSREYYQAFGELFAKMNINEEDANSIHTFAPDTFNYFTNLLKNKSDIINSNENGLKKLDENKVLDFGKENENAKVYSLKNYQEWTKDFSDVQNALIDSFKTANMTPNSTNNLLIKYRGNIRRMEAQRNIAIKNNRPLDPQLEKAITEVNLMNKLIKIPENKTTEKQVIYTRFRATDFGYADDSDIESWKVNLDEGKIKKFMDNFEFGKFPDLRIGYLTEKLDSWGDRLLSNSRILVELEVPVGTYLAHLGNGQVIFPSDYGMELTNKDIVTIRESGKSLLKIKAKLVNKEEIDNKILNEEYIMNQVVATALISKGIDKDISSNFHTLNSFDFSGLNASFAIKNAQIAMIDLINNDSLPGKLLKDVLSNLQKDMAIMFMETPINMNEEVAGDTIFSKDPKERPFIRINASPQSIVSEFDEHISVSGTLQHEIAHVIDQKILNKISESSEFKVIFEKEKNGITEINTNNDYAKLNSTEFFAEVFKSMVSMGNKNHKAHYYREAIRKEVPETVKFIEDKLRERGYILKS